MKITYDDLARQLADRLTESVDMESLIRHFWENQYDYYRDEADDHTLRDDAINLGLISEDEDLEIL